MSKLAKKRSIVNDVEDLTVGSAEQITSIMTQLATAVSMDLAPPVAANVFSHVKAWEDNLKDIGSVLRTKLLGLILSSGEATSDKGSKQLTLPGWLLEARVRRSGVDSKKLEAMLRAKGLSPQQWMRTVVKYEVDDEKLMQLVEQGHTTSDELSTCNHETEYNVMRPKVV